MPTTRPAWTNSTRSPDPDSQESPAARLRGSTSSQSVPRCSPPTINGHRWTPRGVVQLRPLLAVASKVLTRSDIPVASGVSSPERQSVAAIAAIANRTVLRERNSNIAGPPPRGWWTLGAACGQGIDVPHRADGRGRDGVRHGRRERPNIPGRSQAGMSRRRARPAEITAVSVAAVIMAIPPSQDSGVA